MKVKIRKKRITKSRETLYLDYYPGFINPVTKKRSRRESLGLFLYSEHEQEERKYIDEDGIVRRRIIPVLDKNGKPKKSKLSQYEKIHNENVMNIALKTQMERQIEIFMDKFKFPNKLKQNNDFIKFYEDLVNKKEKQNTKGNWESSLKYIKKFTGGSIAFKDITIQFCNDYKHFLLTTDSLARPNQKLANNTSSSYFVKFQSALKHAYLEGYIGENLNQHLTSISVMSTHKDYLTLKELQTLVNTPVKIMDIKKGLIFAALTGLRFSDIEKMVWGEIRKNETGYSYEFISKKKSTPEYIPISDLAATIMGIPKEDSDKVFSGLKYSAFVNSQIQDWVDGASIDKKIGWHNFRHSFSFNLHELGVDEYTRSRLLTHGRNGTPFRQTANYTQVSERKLREAVNKLKLDLSKIND